MWTFAVTRSWWRMAYFKEQYTYHTDKSRLEVTSGYDGIYFTVQTRQWIGWHTSWSSTHRIQTRLGVSRN